MNMAIPSLDLGFEIQGFHIVRSTNNNTGFGSRLKRRTTFRVWVLNSTETRKHGEQLEVASKILMTNMIRFWRRPNIENAH